LTQGIGAANAAVGGSQVPMNTYNQYLSGIASIPTQMPNFGGTIGSVDTTRTTGGNINAQGVNDTISTGMGIVNSLGQVINGVTGTTGGIGGAIGSAVRNIFG
jgi:hypothetical protein